MRTGDAGSTIAEVIEDFEDPASPLVIDKACAHTFPESDLDLRNLVHWRDSTVNTEGHKRKFLRVTQQLTEWTWDRVKDLRRSLRPIRDIVVELWQGFEMSHQNPPYLADDFCRTIGALFY